MSIIFLFSFIKMYQYVNESFLKIHITSMFWKITTYIFKYLIYFWFSRYKYVYKNKIFIEHGYFTQIIFCMP